MTNSSSSSGGGGSSSSSSSNNADYVQLPIKPVLAEPA
jgi:hypothetical protein